MKLQFHRQVQGRQWDQLIHDAGHVNTVDEADSEAGPELNAADLGRVRH